MRLVAALALVLALAACSRQELFVVLPNPDGSAGQITVDDGKTQLPLNKPYAAGEVRGGSAETAAVDAPQVQQISAPRSPPARSCRAISGSTSSAIATP